MHFKSSSYFFTKNISTLDFVCTGRLNPIALRNAKIVYNFGLSECSRVKEFLKNDFLILTVL